MRSPPLPVLRCVAASLPCLALGACLASPTTFVLSQAQRRAFESYEIKYAPIADDPPFDSGLEQDFVAGLKAGLEGTPTLRPLQGAKPDRQTLSLHYRAAGLSEGSLVARAGSAAVNAFLPVSVVPEIGGGDLGIETTFLDGDGVVVGRVLVQANVRGLLSTDGMTMKKIGAQTAEYVASRFTASTKDAAAAPGVEPSKHVINLCPEKARQELAPLEPLIGEWDLVYEFELAGAQPIKTKVHEVSRWEAGGRAFWQFVETLDAPENMFRCNLVVWDPRARSSRLFVLDSAFGVHDSRMLTVEREGRTLKLNASEEERITEVVEVLSEDGNSRTGTKKVWSGDRSRLLLSIRSSGTKRH